MPLDPSFSRENRPLADWLLQVVVPDAAARSKALEVLQAMQMGVASTDTELGEIDEEEMKRHQARFRAEVERTVLDPAFPGPDYIRGLAALILGKHTEWMRQNKLSMDRFDKVIDRLLNEQQARADRKKRLAKALCAETREGQAATDALMTGVFAGLVFQSLGAAILLAPDAVRALLADRSNKHIAFDALAAAGPKAAPEFLPDLLAIKHPEHDSSIMAAVLAVGAGDSRLIQNAVDSIRKALSDAPQNPVIPPTDSHEFHKLFYDQHSAWRAVGALHSMGPLAREAPGIGPTLVPLLLELSHSPLPGHRAAAAAMLGACTRGDEPEQVRRVADRLLTLTEDHSWVVGRAIDALGDLRSDDSRIVPRLGQLLDTYTEFDPDAGYNGPHSRIRHALEQLLPASRAAIPALLSAFERSAHEKHPEFAREVFQSLRKLGAEPANLIPVLQRMRTAGKHYDKLNKQEWQRQIDEAIAVLGAT